jgi:hypothetical protein
VEAQTIASILGAVVSALVIGGTVVGWVVRPIRQLLQKVECLDDKVSFHLDANGHDTDDKKRALRTMVIDAETAIGEIKKKQARDFDYMVEHGKVHARHGIE